MAPPTTILGFATDRLANAQNALAAVQVNLSAAQSALTSARAAKTDATDELAALQAENTRIRADLQSAPTPADGVTLVQELEENMIAVRAQTAAVVAADEALDAGTRSMQRAQNDVQHANAEAAVAAEAEESATQQADEHAAWKAALAESPLATLRADAASAQASGSSPYKEAKARVEADVPAALRTRARVRDADQRVSTGKAVAEAAVAQAVLDAEAGKNALTGDTQVKLAEFRSEEAELRDYALTAKERFDRALAMLAAIPEAPPLTAEESAEIGQFDPTAQPPLSDAITAEEERDAARTAVIDASHALDDSIVDFLKTTPDGEPNADATVQAKAVDLQAAESTLTAKEQAWAALANNPLQQWEVAVPDRIWTLFADFDEAEAILDDLATVDPATLVADMNAAELAYVTALVAETTSNRVRLVIGDRLEERVDVVAVLSRSERSRVFSARRGDG